MLEAVVYKRVRAPPPLPPRRRPVELHNRPAKIATNPHRTRSGAGSGVGLGNRFGFGFSTPKPVSGSVKPFGYFLLTNT
jgi:hypothetical protein